MKKKKFKTTMNTKKKVSIGKLSFGSVIRKSNERMAKRKTNERMIYPNKTETRE